MYFVDFQVFAYNFTRIKLSNMEYAKAGEATQQGFNF